MDVFFDPRQLGHDPRHFLVRGRPRPSPEQPARARRLLAAARAAGHTPLAPAAAADPSALAAVHTPGYLRFLQTVHARWQRLPDASAEVVANVHPRRRGDACPDHPVAEAGYYMADTACPVGAGTWDAVCWSAAAALAAARHVVDGAAAAYALCRPPGHHACADQAGGFCYLNNAALAATALRGRWARVAVVDVDVHHGNGTQQIFYRRDDVYTLSLHADPARFYPFFYGHADERGDGPGRGYNDNVPLALGSADTAYGEALDGALARLAGCAPQALVVALGLDAYAGDPLRGLAISTPGFAAIGARLGALALPTVLVQEGGYLSDQLGANLVSFLDGFCGARGA